jgi:hypothetical protein
MSKKIDRNDAIAHINEAMAVTNTTSSKSVVNLYNGMAELLGQSPVKKFETRDIANKRLAAIADQLAKQIGYDPVNAPVEPEPATSTQSDEDATDEATDGAAPRVSGSLAAKVKSATAAKANKAAAAQEAKAAAKAEKAAAREARAAASAATKEARAARTADKSGTRSSPFDGKTLHPVREKNPRREGTFGWHSYEIIRKKPGITYEDYRKAGGRPNDLAWDIDHQYVRTE